MELAPGVAIQHNLTLPGCRREGRTVFVDSWGGEGVRMDADGLMHEQCNITGTMTFTFEDEEMAIEIEELVNKWVQSDARVSIEHSPDEVTIINQATGEIVTNNPHRITGE